MERKEVVIIGGGPAGAAAALTLAKRGIKSTIIEAAEQFKLKLGETLPPAIKPVINALGLTECLKEPEHLSCLGNKFVWGQPGVTEKLFMYHTNGNGWHLNRQIFEKQLYLATVDKGIEWHPGKKLVKAVPDNQKNWQVTVEGNQKQFTMESSFLVDATGRASNLALCLDVQRKEFDRLVGVASLFDLDPDREIARYTYIEAVENGWWYAALLPDNRLITVFMTDGDLLDRKMMNRAYYRQALENTGMIASLLPEDREGGGWARPIIRKASNSCLEKVYGWNWLAVGDAAYAYDPISSYGIISALGGGFYAGNAVADHLTGKQEALPAYSLICQKAYNVYLHMLNNQYLREQRWPQNPFWKRRHTN